MARTSDDADRESWCVRQCCRRGKETIEETSIHQDPHSTECNRGVKQTGDYERAL